MRDARDEVNTPTVMDIHTIAHPPFDALYLSEIENSALCVAACPKHCASCSDVSGKMVCDVCVSYYTLNSGSCGGEVASPCGSRASLGLGPLDSRQIFPPCCALNFHVKRTHARLAMHPSRFGTLWLSFLGTPGADVRSGHSKKLIPVSLNMPCVGRAITLTPLPFVLDSNARKWKRAAVIAKTSPTQLSMQ